MKSHKKTKAQQGKVGWLELLFDLVFVASLSLVNDDLREDFTWQGLGFIVVALAALFVIWITVTLVSNRFPDEGEVRRTLVIIIMLSLLVSALSVSGAAGLEPFIGQLSFAVTLFAVGALFVPLPRMFQVPRKPVITSVALLWGAALMTGGFAFLPVGARGELLVIAIAIIVVGIVVGILQERQLRHSHGVHRGHLMERLGLLMIILLGEGIVVMTVTLRAPDAQTDLRFLTMVFILVFILWRYFFDGTLTDEKHDLRWRTAVLATFILIFGIIGMFDVFADLAASNMMTVMQQDTMAFGIASTVTFIGFALLALARRDELRRQVWGHLAFAVVNLMLIIWVITADADLAILALGTLIVISIDVIWSTAVTKRRLRERSELAGGESLR
jgi:low temperature requirement protein LtrA